MVDDTDRATLANVAPVYDLLADLGIRTTKTVWPFRSRGPSPLEGGTLEDPAYRQWILELRAQGFEIAYHGTADESSTRSRIIAGLDYYRSVLGEDPDIYAAHAGQAEALYWGRKRLRGGARLLYDLLNRLADRRLSFSGDEKDSDYFWGDVCRDRIRFVRGFTFDNIDTAAVDRWMPYHDPSQSYVNWWFSSSDGYKVERFNRLLSEENQDLLVEQGGCCIVYTHFAYGFCRNGVLDEEFRRLMTRLASLGGWFAPTSTILEHLMHQPGRGEALGGKARSTLQWHWLRQQFGTPNLRRYVKRFRRYRRAR